MKDIGWLFVGVAAWLLALPFRAWRWLSMTQLDGPEEIVAHLDREQGLVERER